MTINPINSPQLGQPQATADSTSVVLLDSVKLPSKLLHFTHTLVLLSFAQEDSVCSEQGLLTGHSAETEC